MAKYKTMLEYAKSQEELQCDNEDCAHYYDGKNGNCSLECPDECSFRELFLQVYEESKGNLSHVSDVIPVDSDTCEGCKRLHDSKLNYDLRRECGSCIRNINYKDYYEKNQ